ncbi:winged helix-turn-helix domain-containing protein [Roseibacterium sp. SDUM158017]|uniref:winged helix-turn-helix transcriptional regulator n=1 Tax=Roseicyclus salinarum TaxID=3036773 RepID=UPI002415302A|nr:winged helix-turn-helix domain-containing protein [Roseibacterium sp. SDUM158017]MDG4647982.1 winged helix-turn-helix domain-containing protein [Roseibacterium sp. SDUM158017]
MAETSASARARPAGAVADADAPGVLGLSAGFQPALRPFLAAHGAVLPGLALMDSPEALIASVAEARPDYVLMASADTPPAFLSRVAAASRTASIGVLLLDDGEGRSWDLPPGVIADHVAPRDTEAEVVLTLRALMRRCRPQAMAGRIAHGDLVLDEGCLTFAIRGAATALSLETFGVIGAMMDDPGAVWDRGRLHALVFGRRSRNDIRAIDTRVSRARRHLVAALGLDPIRTVRGVGYALVPGPARLMPPER